MKLTSKEMIILAVFLSIVIIVAGTFLFILPEYEKIEPNRNTLQSAKDEKEQIYSSLERENTIDQEIQDAIDQANTTALYFYDDLTTHEADVIIRDILKATNMSTKSLDLDDYTTSTLTVTDYVETVVNYPLKEYSGYVPSLTPFDGEEAANIEYDENGNLVVPDEYMEKYKDALKEYMTVLLSTQAQTVGSITVEFTIEGTRGDFLNFLNYVADLEKATIVNSTSVAYTKTVSDNNNSNSTEEGEELPSYYNNGSTSEVQVNDRTEIAADITMTLYCITPMQPQEETSQATETETEPAA